MRPVVVPPAPAHPGVPVRRFGPMQTHWDPGRDSIFGDTYNGVPNPMVPHVHPWPTRYHGPIFTNPGVAKPTYRERDYAKPPFMGMGQHSGMGAVSLDVSGSSWIDALLGAGVGLVAAPQPKEQPLWVIAGAIAAYAAGWAGMAGTVGAGVLLRPRR